MEFRNLGNTQLRVSAIGLGCSRIGRSVFEDNRRGSRAFLDAAFDAGINFFDTSPTYSYGDSERLIGAAFATRRAQVYFATKGGFRLSSSARIARYLLPVLGPFRKALGRRRIQLKQSSRKRQDFSTAFLGTQLDDSLRRLRTDYVDLYQLHSPPAEFIGSGEVQRFLENCVRAGKVRYCAASVNTVEEANVCLGYPVFSALQLSFNLLDQAPATHVLPRARATGVGIIVKTPLHRGLLTGNFRVMTGPAPEPVDDATRARRAQSLAFMLSDQHPSVEMASLRFILDHPEVSTVLTGTTNLSHLRSNIDAVPAGPLPDHVMRRARSLYASPSAPESS